ncbi:MAG: hypothetical protein L6V81_03380 [Clostridium sp.]|nr:MAG: hypothetical protein L6V81_03380 [Clostridium sp.]
MINSIYYVNIDMGEVMKKFILIIIMLLLLCSCKKKEATNEELTITEMNNILFKYADTIYEKKVIMKKI